MAIFGLIFLAIPFSITLLIASAIFGFKRALIGNLIAYPVSLLLLVFIGWLSSPTKPSRSDIIGHYEIDRSHYTGANADWQHENYTMEITEKEVIIRDYHRNQVQKSPIRWTAWSDYRWGFDTPHNRHHLINNGPTYRQSFSHYYVFKSAHYGNVFFVKKSLLLREEVPSSS